ncbi:MAG: esterase/lipase family protein [Gemmatimonadaceae bacterium]
MKRQPAKNMIITVRRGVALALMVAAMSACTETSAPRSDILTGCETPGSSPASVSNDPILFVHGYAGNGGNWQDMKAKFLADGWQPNELYACNYSFTASNVTSAAEIGAQVDEILRVTGASKVDIVSFSIGSVSSRYYLKNLGGTSKVDAWVSLAGPNHGTDAVEINNCSFTPCREIAPGSTFLADLNNGDETPGLVRYATWRSPCDTTINPDESVILFGATNNVTACIPHLAMLTDPVVYSQVRAWVD